MPTTPRLDRRVTAVIAVLAASALVMILNETVLSVALPDLMAAFAVTAATAQWLTTGFMLTMAIVIPTTGYLIQRLSTRTVFVVALTLFLAGTALAVVAPSFGVMLLARVVQACGTAIVLPLLMTTTLTLVPAERRGSVMGLNAVVISAAPAIGPTLSGVVVDSLGWRWLFAIMFAVAVVTLALGLALVRPVGGNRRVPLDPASVLLSAVAFGGIVYGLATVATLLDGGSAAPVVSVVVGLAALTVFVLRQVRLQRDDAALLDLRAFTVPTFRLSVVVVMIAMASMLGTVVVLPIYLQSGLGVSVLATGLLLLPGGLVQGLVSPVVGRLYDLVGLRPLVLPGAVLLCGGQWLLSSVGADTSLAVVVAMHVVFCVGMAVIMTSLMAAALGALPRHLYGHGSAIMNTLQQVAGAAGIAVFVAALTLGATTAGGAAAQVAGTRAAFVVGGVLTAVAVVLAPLIGRTTRPAGPPQADAGDDVEQLVGASA